MLIKQESILVREHKVYFETLNIPSLNHHGQPRCRNLFITTIQVLNQHFFAIYSLKFFHSFCCIRAISKKSINFCPKEVHCAHTKSSDTNWKWWLIWFLDKQSHVKACLELSGWKDCVINSAYNFLKHFFCPIHNIYSLYSNLLRSLREWELYLKRINKNQGFPGWDWLVARNMFLLRSTKYIELVQLRIFLADNTP